MRFVFRADGNAETGLGHITRCAALAAELRKYGDVHFISTPLSIKLPFAVHELSRTDNKTDAELTRRILLDLRPDVVIVDHHNLDQAYLDSIKAFTDLLVVIDDLKREICSDVVVNVNCFSLKMKYECKKGKVFLGPKYSLIRKIKPRAAVNKHIKKIMVSMGGADMLNLTPKVIAALRDIDGQKTIVIGQAFTNEKEVYNAVSDDKRFSVVRTDDLPRLMLSHDIAICGGGTTLYELAATGTPSIILCQAENQFINAGELDGKTLISLGMGGRASVNKIKSTVDSLISNYELRRRFSRNGKRLVDCKGPERVSKIILVELRNRKLELKPATKKDTKDLWKWRNEKTTSMNSFTTEPIPLNEHLKWFSKALRDKRKRIFVIYNNNRKIGYVRIDFNGEPELNIALGKEYRKLGFGIRAIRLACESVKSRDIIARIKTGNEASIKAFERAGFSILSRSKKAITMKSI